MAIGRFQPFHYPLHFHRVHLHLPFRDDKAQVFNPGLFEFALFRLKVQLVFLESLEHQFCDPLVFRESLRENQDVVDVDAHGAVRDEVSENVTMVWKVAGLLVRLKNMTRGSNRPQFIRNAAFHSFPSLIQTLLYLHLTSSLVKNQALQS